MSTKPKPCPFCGNESPSTISPERSMECFACGALVMWPVDQTNEESIAAWNKRPDPWISVKDELPKSSEIVFVYGSKHVEVSAAMYGGDEFMWYGQNLFFNVTHWMRISAPE